MAVETRTRGEAYADLRQAAESGWDRHQGFGVPRGELAMFRTERAGLPEVSLAEAGHYAERQRAGRPWLQVAEHASPEALRIIVAADQGGGHGHIRHEGWATEEASMRRAAYLEDPAQLDQDKRRAGIDGLRPGGRNHVCASLSTRVTDPDAFATALARGYARASYELNLGCNYDCEHCYLGDKQFSGLDWPGRERLLNVMAEAGVLWLQLTGGEPLIDPLFAETHARAWDMGMMIQISSNGSRLDQARTLETLTQRRPYRLTLSIYGATEASYDGMTRRRGSFRRFMRGLAAAHEAGLAMRINIIVSNRNAGEISQMKAIADRHGIESFEYRNISPTIHGGAEVLPSQAREVLRKKTPYTGCNAGITHFHADPHGRASICKIGRDPQVDLLAEGVSGLSRLAETADRLVTRHGGCSGCTLQKTCGTCMPLASLYRQAKAPLDTYCQHGGRV